MSEFQKKMQEAKDKAQEGLSEFQRKMLEKKEQEKKNSIRATAFNINFNADSPRLYYEYRKVAS